MRYEPQNFFVHNALMTFPVYGVCQAVVYLLYTVFIVR